MTRIVFSDGVIIYTDENGRYHREDGPAITHSNGVEQWFKNGKLHREDGPAVTSRNYTEYWYRNNENITELVKDHVHNWRNWTDKEKLVFKLKFL